MPTIQFKGKTFVQNHHLAVPHHQLVPDKKKSLTDRVSLHDNLIIHGDNLLALKALLPTYAGKVKCIYIDPPYNTGNEGWIYNDKVNSPIINEWIGKVVGKEGEDLTRHDKWLCMMMPRLKLLKELLADDGAIFMSIDHNELGNLRILMDEIFPDNFLGIISVVNNLKGRSDDEFIATANEFLLVYAKNKRKFEMGGLPLSKIQLIEYDQEDEWGRYKEVGFRKTGKGWRKKDRPNMFYPIYFDNTTGKVSITRTSKNDIEILPLTTDGEEGRWRWGIETFLDRKDRDIVVKQVRTGRWQVFTKMRLDYNGEHRTLLPKSIWIDPKYDTAKGAAFLKEVLHNDAFDNPKPLDFITDILRVSCNKNDLVLDSFAGSGTTAQAVLELNKEDGGSRKFILVEMGDYADKITAERIRRVIKGAPNSSNELLRKGLGSTFSYFELGDPIEISNILSGKSLPTYLELARYVYYTATGEEFDDSKLNEVRNFIGRSKSYDIYMYYKPDIDYLKTTALTLDEARNLRKKAGKRPLLVFAPTKYVEQTELDNLQITFCQLPFEIYKVKG